MITNFRLPDGAHSPLSNFYPSWVRYQEQDYPTVEHAFQAAKSPSAWQRNQIAQLPTPGQAKRLGRTLDMRVPDWEAAKLGVMRDLLRLKFTGGSGLAHYLRNTGDQLLVEGNTWGDRFWGQSPLGQGANWLGFLLMAVRAELVAS